MRPTQTIHASSVPMGHPDVPDNPPPRICAGFKRTCAVVLSVYNSEPICSACIALRAEDICATAKVKPWLDPERPRQDVPMTTVERSHRCYQLALDAYTLSGFGHDWKHIADALGYSNPKIARDAVSRYLAGDYMVQQAGLIKRDAA